MKIIINLILLSNIPLLTLALLSSDKIYRSVNADRVNIRTAPNIKSKIITQKNKGDVLIEISRTNKPEIINGSSGYWVEVDDGFLSESEVAKGKPGWIFSKFLDSYENSAEYLYNRAIELEKTNNTKAVRIFKKIISQYPNAIDIIAMDCLGNFSEYSEDRIKIISCKKIEKDNPTKDSLKEISSKLSISLKNNNKNYLSKISSCEVVYDNSICGYTISKENIFKIIDVNDIDVNKISIKNQTIHYKSKRYGSDYYFSFKKTDSGLLLNSFGNEL